LVKFIGFPRCAIGAAAIFVLLGGCSKQVVRSGTDCFPKEAAKWLATKGEPDAFAGRKEPTGTVTFYVDQSGSMAGYLNGGNESEKPFQDLIVSVPTMFSAASSPVRYRSFASELHSLGKDARDRLSQADYYTCQRRSDTQCDNANTRLDKVFEDIASQGEELALVLTDLWFSDPASVTTGLVPLAGPLKAILASGRAVGVFGIPAPFSGTIFDLPGGQRTNFTGKRPLMLLAIGSNARVLDFREKLKRAAPQSISRDMQSGAIRQAIFTVEPASGIEPSDRPLALGNDPRVQSAVVLASIPGVRIQQFRVGLKGARRPSAAGIRSPSWQGPDKSKFFEGAVWEGPLRSRTLVWERRNDQCAKSDWRGPSRSNSGWKMADVSGQMTYQLDPALLLKELRKPGLYLVTGEVARTSLNSPSNAATQWLRDWSFSSGEQFGAAPREGKFFKTLNLSEFSRLLEGALADAAERNPGPITGFTYVVEVAD